MFTYSRHLLEVVTKISSTLERRLGIDVSALNEWYTRFEIDQLVFLRRNVNIADALTKTTPNPCLEAFFSNNRDHTEVG